MNVQVFNREGEVTSSITVSDSLANADANPQLAHNVIVGYLRNARQGTAATRNKSMVRCSGSKPWRQKGTGRARVGSAASPLWRGGGVIFGPHPRNFSRPIPQRLRKELLRGVFADKLRGMNVRVVDEIISETGKTRELAALLKRLDATRKPLLLMRVLSDKVKRAARNIPGCELSDIASLNAHMLMCHDTIVIGKDDFESLQERLQ